MNNPTKMTIVIDRNLKGRVNKILAAHSLTPQDAINEFFVKIVETDEFPITASRRKELRDYDEARLLTKIAGLDAEWPIPAGGNCNMCVRVDRDLRDAAMLKLEDYGMHFSDAITVFLKQTAFECRLPFESEVR